MHIPDKRPTWIWHRPLLEAGHCRLCGRRKWAVQYGSTWEVCCNCDSNPDSPPPPSYR